MSGSLWTKTLYKSHALIFSLLTFLVVWIFSSPLFLAGRGTPSPPLHLSCSLAALHGHVNLFIKNKRFLESGVLAVRRGTLAKWKASIHHSLVFLFFKILGMDIISILFTFEVIFKKCMHPLGKLILQLSWLKIRFSGLSLSFTDSWAGKTFNLDYK